ncbi:MAG: flavin reductase [Oscillospiraceae bacterium]|nr:flavin reductase [Oscillospiraceae bacterium]
MTITRDIRYVGVNDHQIDLFEGQYKVPLGMAYNSYLILDRKIAVMDTVDQNFTRQWLTNLSAELCGRQPDYLVVQHMEPDHSANIKIFMDTYPNATLVSSAKAFPMMKNFFGTDFAERRIEVKEGDTLELGEHVLHFVQAPMVHWPEVIMTYDAKDKVLFSADGFGKFGANDVLDPEGWDCEARRYYIGIVGKYGPQVQAVLKKAANLDIQIIAPLHGPVLNEDLGHYLKLYNIWSSYAVESDGIVVAYTSVYGHTKAAAQLLAKKLKEKGCPKVEFMDLAREDMAECVEKAFEYGRIVLATTTYNAGIFPFMRDFIEHLTERNFQKRTVAFIENGSWAPMAAKIMKGMLEGCKNLSFANTTVHLKGGLSEESEAEIEKLADELCVDYLAQHDETANKSDLTALFKIGYGLYVVTARDGSKDNGCIVNTVTQVTNTPNRIAVCINKANYTHELAKKTGMMNVNCLSVEVPFSTFQHFGFQSGRNVNKFPEGEYLRSDNGVIFLDKYINAFMSLKVEQYVDLDTHGMFICTVTEARVLSSKETVTYNYYQSNIKPKPETDLKKGWVCKVCGYVYEGEVLPDDFICPLCKHGAADFEPLG